MARFVALFALCALVAAATTISGVNARGGPINVTGRVYVDTCNVGFETTHSIYPAGSNVKLECVNRKTDEVIYTDTAVTNSNGEYRFVVNGVLGDRSECHVYAVSSSHRRAGKPDPARDRALVILTGNNGIASNTRFANSLGFTTNKPLSNCPQIISQYHLNDDNF